MKSGIVFLSLFGVIWTSLVGAFDGFVLYRLVRQTRAVDYPSVPGRITHSEVTRHRGSKGGTTYGVNIEYTYRVGGEEFHGERFRYGEGSSSDSAWARAAVRAHPVGAETRVFHHPANPADSLLKPGVDGSDLMFLLFLTPFNAVMLGLWTAAGAALWQRWRRLPAGGVPLRTTLGGTRVRLAGFGPWVAGLAATGLAGFVSIFIIGFGFGGFHPSLPVVTSAWGVVLGIGLVAALWQARKVGSGWYDLVVDELQEALDLSPGLNAGKNRRIAFTDIAALEVETVVQRGSKGGTSTTYVPVLKLRAGAGPDARLGKFHSEERAVALVAWLREKLRLPA